MSPYQKIKSGPQNIPEEKILNFYLKLTDADLTKKLIIGC
jgi:hypothetical protein